MYKKTTEKWAQTG